MKAMVINVLYLIILIISINLSSSLEFQFISPSSSIVNESFSVSISTSSSITNNYDVKIFINDDSKEFSEIYYDGKWNNPFYYLKEVFPKTKEFKIKSYYVGATNICARLRKTNSSSFSEVCNPITILPNEKKQESKTTNSSPTQSLDSFSKSESPKLTTSISDFVPLKEEMPKKIDEEQPKSNEKIHLNKKTNTQTTHKLKLWFYFFYAFLIIFVLILIYLILRRI
ncbi:MAG: hypothetical protein N3D20_00205 [Candidatus Pacearchaeota archaeon]|nr:hypothetical protein [Candidatus Pacearchaeota archaeon]